MPAEAFVTHQLVQALRNGNIGNTNFSKVMLVGHSVGSGIVVLEASMYQDVDAIVLTGFLHGLNPTASTFVTGLYPAQLDPKFANANLPVGYLTTKPGVRVTYFFNTATADPAVIISREASDYSSNACLEASVQLFSGHDVNLHPNAQVSYDAITDWSNRRIGPNTQTPPTHPCQQ